MSLKVTATGKKKEPMYKQISVSPFNKIKCITSPIPIMRKINDMKSYVDNIYNYFYNGLTDANKQRQIEEYIKLKKLQKLYRIKILKELTSYFDEKLKDIKIKRPKSVKNNLDTEILYMKIIKNLKSIKVNLFMPYLSPIAKEEKMRLNCITEYNMINVIRKLKTKHSLRNSIGLSKTQRLSMQKIKTFASTKNSSHLNKKHKKHLNITFVKQKFINKKSKDFFSENNYSLISFPSKKKGPIINKKYSIFTPNRCTRINSSKVDSKNKFNSNQKIDNSYIRKKLKSILELKQSAFKILPQLSNSFNTTLSKSSNIKNELKIFQNESTIRSANSKKKNKEIIKKFFPVFKEPSLRSSLQIGKNKNFLSIKSIVEKANLKYILNKKDKSPLTFVQDYNKMRNRRIKNKKYENNLGFVFDSSQKKKIKRANALLGMSFKGIINVKT